MKKLYLFLILSFCLAAVCSCNKEIDVEENALEEAQDQAVPAGYKRIVLTAAIDETKTELNNRGNTVWSENDAIKVFFSDGTSGNAGITGGIGETSATFTITVPETTTGNPVYAVYPANLNSSVSGSTVNVTVPASQDGTFAAGNIAVAKIAANHSMSFKNVNSFLVFQLKDGSEVTKVEVTSVDGSALAGTVPVNCSGDTPAAGAATSPASTVSMTTNGVGTYYMSIVSGATHAKGLKMTYYTGSGTYTETGVYYLNRNLTIAANQMYTLGEVETDKNYYVTVSGAGNHTGMDWANAFSKSEMWKRLTLTEAQQLDPAEEGADPESKQAKIDAINGATFHMGAGTYDFGSNPTISFNESSAVSLTFKGGYPAAGGEQNIASYATNITGSRTGTSGSYSGHCCLTLSGNMSVTLEGLHFINGYTSGQYDGALYCAGSSLNVTMTDCEVSNNLNSYASTNGGTAGLYLEANQLTATRVVFSGNQGKHAPALYCKGTNMTLNNCQFNSNTASSWGGAIRIREGNPTCTFYSCSFNGNSASGDAGCFVINDGTINFNTCTFTGNHSSNNGGAIRVLNGTCTVNISGGSFKGNYVSSNSGNGGAIRLEEGSPVLIVENCTFGASGEANYSNGDGGALSMKVGTTTLTNCTFTGNYALNDDATRIGTKQPSDSDYLSDPDAGYGGAIDCYNTANLTINGGTFSNNVAWKGGAINGSGSGTTTITGATFTGNGGNTTRHGGAVRFSSEVNFTNCTFGGDNDSDKNEALMGGALYIEGGTTSIDGCTFSKNLANTTDSNFGGGAIYMRGGSNVEIENSGFNSNTTTSCGGAICAWPDDGNSQTTDDDAHTNSLTISNNCSLDSNHADKFAGAILYKVKGSMTVSDTEFTGNDADEDSGALNLDKANALFSFTRVTFSGNHADGDNGGVMWNEHGNYTFSNCHFLNNYTANGFGGAIYIKGDGNSTSIEDSDFKGNYCEKSSSAEGGAIRMDTGSPYLTLTGCTFGGDEDGDANHSDMDGGALSLKAGTTGITNCDFIGNYAMNDVATRITPDKGYGGAIDCYNSANLTISGGTFSGNKAWRGGAINSSGPGTLSVSGVTFTGNGGSTTRHGGVARVSRSCTFTNCTFGGDSEEDGNVALSGGAIYANGEGTMSITGCSFQRNHTTATTSGSTKTYTGGALHIESLSKVRIKNSHFIGNFGAKGGAIQATKDDSDQSPLLFINACSFSGNYIQYGYGTAINVDFASDFAINNCSFNDDTYLVSNKNTNDIESCWIGVDGIANKAIISNCSLIGRPLYNESSVATNGALVGVYSGADEKTVFVNNLILNNGNDGFKSIAGDGSTNKTVLSYYNHYTNIKTLTLGSGSTGDLTGKKKSDTREASSTVSSWKGTYWKFLRYTGSPSYDKISKTDFRTYLNNACSDFVTWLGTDIDKDCLGNSRGDTDWRPGAYQGN